MELSFWGVLRRGPRSAELIASDRAVRDFVVGRDQGLPERLEGEGGRNRGRVAPTPHRRRARARSELRFRLFFWMCFQSLMWVSLSLGTRVFHRERPCVALSFVREGVVGPSVCGVSEQRRRHGRRPCVALELFFWGFLRRGPRSARVVRHRAGRQRITT